MQYKNLTKYPQRFIAARCLSLIAVLFFAGMATTSYAAPGDLDLTFSSDGKVTDLFPGTTSGWFSATAVQPNGKIIAIGNTAASAIYIARYNVDGSPDTTFGDGTGKVAMQLPEYYSFPTGALLPDGKVVMAGCYCHPDGYFENQVLPRFNSDGSLDTSYGSSGFVTLPGVYGAYAVAVQPDGEIVTAGTSSSFVDTWLITQFHTDGSVDFQVSTHDLGYPTSIATQTDGKIVAGGYSHTGDFAVVRYMTSGELDTSFDGDGIAITPITPGWDEVHSIAIQPDGKIVAAGSSNREGADYGLAVVRYLPNGSLDTTFDNDGIVVTPSGLIRNGPSSVAIEFDSKIVVAGTSDNGSNIDFALVRYLPDGTLDRTFGGGDGKATVDFNNSDDRAYGMALDPQGRAVLVGHADGGKYAIARILLGPDPARFDFDGDGRSDISVFRPSDRTWYLDRSTVGFSATQFGLSTDTIVPADYDGDGKTDIAVFRGGTWYWLDSVSGSFHAVQFGLPDDLSVPADYTGDGRAELAVFRDGQWWALNLSNNQASLASFGSPGDKPVPADYDGDGVTDQAVYRNGKWHIHRSTLGYTVAQFGLARDRPVVGDYDGDGKADLAVYRDGTWYLLQSTQGFAAVQWGIATDIPVPADYDGDGKTDVAVFRNKTWYLLQSTAGFAVHQFGLPGDRPIPAAFGIN